MAMIYEPEHADRLREEMYWQFRGKPNIESLLAALAEGIQLFDDLAYDYSFSTLLDVAEGYVLDRLGFFVGAQRLGLDDAEFRAIIRARIAALRSNGTIGEIGHVLALLVEPLEFTYSSAYPAGYQFYFVREDSLTDAQIKHFLRIMELTRPAGVKATYVEGVAGDPDETFRFDVDPGFGRRFSRTL